MDGQTPLKLVSDNVEVETNLDEINEAAIIVKTGGEQKFEDAPEVRELAEQLMQEIPAHQPLMSATFGFLFRTVNDGMGWTKRGRHVIADSKKVTGELKHVTGWDFVIRVAKTEWEHSGTERRTAIIDHELSHCSFEDGTAKTVPHDFEGFRPVIERRGLWNQAAKQMAEQLKQQKLF